MALQIPAEMLQCPQWGAWKLTTVNDRLTKVPFQVRTRQLASSTDLSHWTDSAYAVPCVAYFKPLGQLDGLAFALGLNSGLAGIDLDDVFGSQGEVLRPDALAIVEKFASYTEYSPSRRGLHIIVRANVSSGKRLAAMGLEVYGTGRYFTVTGDVYLDKPIRGCQADIDVLIAEIVALRAQNEPADLDFSAADSMDDASLYNMAAHAANGEKFLNLWHGHWQQYYPSQSEADFALIDQIAFWTDSPNQVIRMFGYSVLGQRDKNVKRPDIVLKMTRRSFDRKLPKVDVPITTSLEKAQITPAQVGPVETIVDIEMTDDEAAWMRSEVFSRPYGMLGDIVDYCLAAAPYPHMEMGVAIAFIIIAGIAGRAFQISATGLNLYLMVLAETGAGKEQMLHAASNIMQSVTSPPINPALLQPGQSVPLNHGYPAADGFMGPGKMTGTGLTRIFAKDGRAAASGSCFCVLSEFEGVLRQIANIGNGTTNSGVIDFKTELLNLYMKSSAGQSYTGAQNADKAKDIARISSPAFSFLCESTPGGIYSVMSEAMVKDGLLPRMIVVEVPPRSRVKIENLDAPLATVPAHLTAQMERLCRMVHTWKSEGDKRQIIQMTEAGRKRLREYKIFTDGKLDNAQVDTFKELWNRAYLNVTRMCGVYAVGVDLFNPTVDAYMVDYCANIVTRQIILMIGKFKRGEVGKREGNENDQYQELKKFIVKWMEYTVSTPFSKSFANRKEYVEARSIGIIPFSYLLMRATPTPCFKDSGRGLKHALRETIDSMIKSGILKQVTFGKYDGTYYKVTL